MSRYLRAVLGAALLAVALPSAAHAGRVSYSADGRDMFYIANSETERNNVTLSGNSTGQLTIRDAAGVTGDSNFCSVVSTVQMTCDSPRESVTVSTGGGDDQVEYRLPHAGFVDLGAGDDVLVAGTRHASDRAIQPVTYFDIAGDDVISYARANRGVSLTQGAGVANDGRPGDREDVHPHFETVIGSNFDDAELSGTPGADTIVGLGGDDRISGGGGDDQLGTGLDDGSDDYDGGSGHDSVSYGDRTAPVLIDLDNVADDGAAGENDNVRSSVESVAGGKGADVITGDGGPDVLSGGPGDDRLSGLDGNDLLLMGAVADGADTVRGGGGVDTVFYGNRTQPINATLNFGGDDDGEAGEHDELLGANEQVVGGKAGDKISAPNGSLAAHALFGQGGSDTLVGAGGDDTLDGGSGTDTLLAGDGDDTLFANDGERDTVTCDFGFDTASIDSLDAFSNCENRTVGALTLAAKGANVKLSWSHPRSWRQLRSVTLRLRGAGKIVIRPRAESIKARGDVAVVRSRLTHRGRTVTARLKLRVPAGRRLVADVIAVDVSGNRQVVRRAAIIRS